MSGGAAEGSGRDYDIPYDARWNRRVARMHALLPPGTGGIVDFGAGECFLAGLAGPRPYHPVDRVALAPGVQVMDLDDWARGAGTLPRAEIAFCSGVLEYLHDPEAFFARVAREFTIMVFSFNVFAGRHPDEQARREARLWRSHQTTAGIAALCEHAGLRLETMVKSKPAAVDYEYLFLAVTHAARPALLAARQDAGDGPAP